MDESSEIIEDLLVLLQIYEDSDSLEKPVILWLFNHKKHNKEKLWIKLVASNTKLIVLVNGKLKNTVLSISTTQKQQKCHVSP